MYRRSVVLSLILGMLYITLSSDIDGPAHHGHGNITGSTTGAIGHCQTSSCHGANNPLTIVQLVISDTSTMLPITTYNALQTYLVTITGDATAITASLPGFGFQASAVLGNHTQAGTYTIPTSLASSIHTYPCGATTVVEHSVRLSPITTGVNKYSIQFYWTAPPPASDSVTFYALLNAVNGDGGSSGDNPDAAPRVTIYENPATATCGVPTALADSFVTPTSAYLYWSSVTGAVSYKIQYHPIDSSAWSSTTATANSTTITGLMPATTYEFKVQTVCSGSPSAFTAINDTLTTVMPSAIPGITDPGNNCTVYPNPAPGNPVISYTLAASEKVNLAVYDITGRKVAQLADNEFQNSGIHEYHPTITAPGLYFIRFVSGNVSNTLRFIKQ